MICLKKLILVSMLFFIILEPVLSQDTLSNQKATQRRKDITHPNIVKINTFALAVSNVSLVYESGIMQRLSVGLGIGYKYTGSMPQILSVRSSRINVSIDEIQGYSFTPELRYYLKTCNPKLLEGFYGGLYFRYTYYFSTVDFTYISKTKEVKHNHADINLHEYGVGIQLGYQLLIMERFSIDFLFFGPRVSNYNFEYKFVRPPAEELLDDLSEHMNEIIDRFGSNYNVNVKKKGELDARSSFSFANIRFGISLGFAF